MNSLMAWRCRRPSSTRNGPSWGKKEGHLTSEEQATGLLGDNWDHVALNPLTKFVVSLCCGKRTLEVTRQLLGDFKQRTEGRIPRLFTSDELSNYETALLETYGILTPVERQGTVGRFPNPVLRPLPELVYATVHKHRENGRVVKVDRRLIYGTERQLRRALKDSPLSSKVNTSYVERYNGTARHRNSRQVRKTYAFSKDWELHEHQSHLSMVGYNFCWTPRTLTRKAPEGHLQRRSPAMAQAVTDHVWTVRELITRQVVRRS